MINVSGRLDVTPGRRDAFLESAREAVLDARRAPGCRDFVVAPDPIESDRVNVYEEWETESDLMSFRGTGPSQELNNGIAHADVSRHHIASSGVA